MKDVSGAIKDGFQTRPYDTIMINKNNVVLDREFSKLTNREESTITEHLKE